LTVREKVFGLPELVNATVADRTFPGEFSSTKYLPARMDPSGTIQ
jgi:hypothetical protein